MKCSIVGLGFNGAETICGIAHILGILPMNSYNTYIFLATTIICSLSALKCNSGQEQGQRKREMMKCLGLESFFCVSVFLRIPV